MKPLFRKTKLAFEDKLVRVVLLGCAFPTTVAIAFSFTSEVSIYLATLLSSISLLSLLLTAFSVRRQVIFQLRTSTNLVEAMASGDYSIRANNRKLEGALADFNDLLNDLSERLAQQSLITKEQQILLSKVTDQIDVAIVAVDEHSNISLMNPAAEALFHKRFEDLQGWPAKHLGLQEVVSRAFDTGLRKVTQFEINQIRRKVYVRTDHYLASGKPQVLIFITDIQNLLRQEERQAWQKLLRVLSHEINNSLAPIASISETLKQLQHNQITEDEAQTPFHNTMLEGLEVIRERAHSLNHFIRDYRQLTHLPSPNKKVFSLAECCQKITQLFEQSQFVYAENRQEVNLFADCEQLQQALMNLVKNAEEANLAQRVDSSVIHINWFVVSNMVYLEVLDQGTGINNEDNIFVPFYTTKKQGTGIGLALSRQIALNHGGDLTLENHFDTDKGQILGAKATLLLPLTDSE